jgi:4-amino-4-deoxy-L-arabinose transferase-like glycosyltransferase
MLLIIPILASVFLFINISALQKSTEDKTFSLRKATIEMMITMGVYLALSSEVLSLVHAINTWGCVIAWSIFLVFNLAIGVVKHLFKPGWQHVRYSLSHINPHEWVFIGLILIILFLTLMTGLLSPPNNYDSHLYHLPRVAHWIQNGDLAHFPSSYINQLAFPILAEEGILGLWLLNGSDALSSLVQWLAFAGSLVAVSYLAKQLGVSRAGQWLTVFFTLSLPGALLQSSSTQNDLVTAFWFACFLIYLVILFKRPLGTLEFLCGSATLGLGMLTKGTFYPYIIIPAALFLWQIIRKTGIKRSGKLLLIAALVIVLLNAGYWARNMITFGTPLGTSTLIISLVSHKVQAAVLLNPVRDLLINLVTPYEEFNHRLLGWLFATPGSSGGALPDYWVVFSWNDEDHAGNPVHLLLVVGCLVIYLFSRKHHERDFNRFTLILLGSFLVFSLGLLYNAYLIRLELPFFIAAAPIFGYVAGKLIKARWLRYGMILLLFVLALPYGLINKYRPLLSLRDAPEPLSLPSHWITGKTAGSIVLEPDTVSFFSHYYEKHDPYLQMVERIKSTECREIGLKIDSSDPEYPFWWLLSAPQSGYRLESMNILPETERYIDPQFAPCAVICTVCDDRPDRFGLKLAGHYDRAFLYLDE